VRNLRGHANAQEVKERHALPRGQRLVAGIDVVLPHVSVIASRKAMSQIHCQGFAWRGEGERERRRRRLLAAVVAIPAHLETRNRSTTTTSRAVAPEERSTGSGRRRGEQDAAGAVETCLGEAEAERGAPRWRRASGDDTPTRRVRSAPPAREAWSARGCGAP
jgi:hypothetical protein